MSDAFWMFLGTLVITVGGLVAAYLKAREAAAEARQANRKSHENAASLAVVRDDIKTVEKATNSLTEQLVAKTGEAAFAAGAAEQREKTDTSPAAQAAIIAAAIIATAQIAADKVKADARTAEAKLKADEENRKG